MTHNERLMAAFRGEAADRLPYVPRLDIWYNANRRALTLPGKYTNATLIELTDDLDLGYHAVIPAFRDFTEDAAGPADIGLGIYRFRALPYAVTFHNIRQTAEHMSDGVTLTEYITPYGALRTRTRYDSRMKNDGATLSVTLEHAVKGPRDYKAAAYLFENAEVTPNYDYLRQFKNEIVGHRGVAVAYAQNFCSPMYYLLKELMPIEAFFVELYENPCDLAELAGRLARFCDKIFDAACLSPADVVMSGANYDASITTPPFFARYIAPDLKRQARQLHENGKFLATHADGENTGLLEQYRDCGVDVADSICPAPMTKKTLKDVMGVFNKKTTVWGGIPSVCVLDNSMDERAFDEFLEMTFDNIGTGRRLVLSIADTTPPGAKFERILKIKRMADNFRPV